MSSSPPPIDQRSYEDIVQQTMNFVEQNTSWRRGSQPDAGEALIRIFGRMAKLVSDRLNQVPDKNFLAFLNLIGTQIAPAQPARVPLQFSLSTSSPTDAIVLVPAQTQIAAPPASGNAEAVVFETEQDLVMTTTQLKAIFVHQPNVDRYSDRTAVLDSPNPEAFEVFQGDRLIEHSLYVACDKFWSHPGRSTVTLKIVDTNDAGLDRLDALWTNWQWSYWDGKSWQRLDVTPDKTDRNTWEVNIGRLDHAYPLTIFQQQAIWLQAQLNPDLLPEGSLIKDAINELPAIREITTTTQFSGSQLQPDFCFFNTVPIDLKKDFYPFGEQPRFNDALYIASQEAFSRGEISVELAFEISSEIAVNPNLTLAWEAWDGDRWRSIKQSSLSDTPIKLDLPETVAALGINGQTNYWIRARITNQDNYGTVPGQTVTATSLTVPANPVPANQTQQLNVQSVRGFVKGDTITIGTGTNTSAVRKIADIQVSENAATLILTERITSSYPEGTSVMWFPQALSPALGAPLMKRLRINYSYNVEDIPLSNCLTLNRSNYVDQLDTLEQRSSFKPFTASTEEQPALYLGFDRAFANQPVTLYLQVAEPAPEEVAAQLRDISAPDAPSQVIWEYAAKDGWKPLGVVDGTIAFTQRGMIQFIGPADSVAHIEFGQSLFWLRARLVEDTFRATPRLYRLLTNTIWASQTLTLRNEVLGSSDANPNQKFQTNQAPVLPNQQLDVREPKTPSFKEQTAIQQLEGADAIASTQDDAGTIEAVWVRWHEVNDFYESSAHDRHYVLDRLTGVVQFGDGQFGRVPPLGPNNIRMTAYRTGGGKQGNQPANSVTQLKTTIPYIDRVTNLEAAAGAADQETLEQVKVRGPKTLRHGWKAVTAQDFEDLAYEASSDVARSKAIALSFDSGQFNPLEIPWLPVFPFQLVKAGQIIVTLKLIAATDPSRANELISIVLRLQGPGQRKDEQQLSQQPSSELRIAITVSADEFESVKNREWQVTLFNKTSFAVSANLTIQFPDGRSLNTSVTMPPPSTPIPEVGQVMTLIVPNSPDRQPIPSLALLDRVTAYLRDRSMPTVHVSVSGPKWATVSVEADIVAAVPDQAANLRAIVLQRLDDYLHPLTGGDRGQGWEFGQFPHKSDIYALLSAIHGVDSIKSVEVRCEPFLQNPTTHQDIPKRFYFLIHSGLHTITLNAREVLDGATVT